MTKIETAYRVGQAIVATANKNGFTAGRAYRVYGVRTYQTGFATYVSYVLEGSDGGCGETPAALMGDDSAGFEVLSCKDCDHPVDSVDVDAYRDETGDKDGVPARCFECQIKWDIEHQAVRA